MTDDEVREVVTRALTHLSDLRHLVGQKEWVKLHKAARRGEDMMLQIQEAIESDPQESEPVPELPKEIDPDPDELRRIMLRHDFM